MQPLKPPILKPIFILWVLAVLHLCWLSSYGWAKMVSTESVLELPTQADRDRQHLLDLLNRKNAREALSKFGVSRVEAVARINSMSDDEVIVFNERLNGLASGGRFGNDDWELELFWIALLLGFIVVGVLVLVIVKGGVICPLSDDSYGQCMENIFVFGDDDKDEPSTHFSPLEAQCQSPCYNEYSSCMEDVDGEEGAEKICLTEKDICLKQCSR